jgi:hypothetical protein
MPFSFGSDPEFMLRDAAGNYRSAIGVIPGTKKEPVSLGGGHLALWDNVLAECCPHYGRTKEEALANFRDCFQRLADLVHPLRLTPQASHEYPESECEHPGAKEFGCDPEMNAYEMLTLPPPSCAAVSTFRSGGGHIHLGALGGDDYPLTDYLGRWWVTRYLDWWVGLPSVLMDTDPTSQARRRLYGGAGNMRPKEYGIEYRTLSVFWLRSPALVSTVWDLCEFTLGFMTRPDHQSHWDEHQAAVREAINTGDRRSAARLFARLAKQHAMPAALVEAVQAAARRKEYDFYGEWGIKTK